MQRNRRNFIIGIVVVLPFFCGPALGKQSSNNGANSGQTSRVAGVIVDANTGVPLSKARVSLANTKNRKEPVWVITQEDGRFEFLGLVQGKYSLQGAKTGYIPAAYEQHEQFSTAIVTGTDFDTQKLTLRLVPMATITGKVVDENGEGVRNARVSLYKETHQNGATRVVLRTQGDTDDEGTFEFTPLGPGKYFVSVNATPWYALHQSIAATKVGAQTAENADRSLDVVYPTTFSGGATDSDGAESILVKGGDHSQIVIHLSPVQALRLILHFDENGQRRGVMPVLETRIFGVQEHETVQSSQGSSSPGVEEIYGLAPGRYTIRTEGNGPDQTQTSDEVELRQDGQSLDESKPEPLGSVKISLKVPNDTALPKLVQIGLMGEQENSILAFNPDVTDGEALFEHLPARKYSIRVFSSEKLYSVARLTSGDTQISGNEFSLAPGESRELSAVLMEGKTRIEGFVKRGDKAASGVMVVLIPKEPETHQDLFWRDQSDSDGSFSLPNVIPGVYTLVAIEDAWGFDWSKPNLLAHYAEHGQTLTIGELMQGSVFLPDPVEVQPR